MKTLVLNQKWFKQHYVNKTLPKKTIYGIVKQSSQSPVNVEISTKERNVSKERLKLFPYFILLTTICSIKVGAEGVGRNLPH